MRLMLGTHTRDAYGARAREGRKQPHARVPRTGKGNRPQPGRTTLWMIEAPP
jgi:hypothetical protein